MCDRSIGAFSNQKKKKTAYLKQLIVSATCPFQYHFKVKIKQKKKITNQLHRFQLLKTQCFISKKKKQNDGAAKFDDDDQQANQTCMQLVLFFPILSFFEFISVHSTIIRIFRRKKNISAASVSLYFARITHPNILLESHM